MIEASHKAKTKTGPTGLLVLVLVAVMTSGSFAALWFSQDWTVNREPAGLIASIYDPPSRPIEAAINQGDGQIFALQASDPLIRRTDLFGSPVPGHHAYRWERPLYGYLGWAFSMGNPNWVPEALVVLTVLSVAALVGSIALAIEEYGGDTRLALLALLLPGVSANLRHIGPESLAAALMVVGVVAWDRRTGPGWFAIFCFASAALCRETMLLVPASLALQAQFGRCGGKPFSWKPDAWRMATAALPLAAWVCVLRWRIGVWPEPSNETLIDFLPLHGFLAGTNEWSTWEVVAAAVVVVSTIWLVVVARRTPFAPVVYAYSLFALVVGETMWGDDMKFGRLLLPLTVIAIIQLARVIEEHEAPALMERQAASSL